MTGITAFEVRERLHVDIGSCCNNNCLFCMEEDRAGRTSRVGDVTPGEILAVLEANVFREEVVFVSGEPTLNPRFLEYVSRARELGYRSVGVISNGRRFSYRPFARAAARQGLNHAIVSIHGGSPAVHDGLTRTPGSFAQALEGLRNLASLRGGGLRLHTSSVINRRNATPARLRELVEVLRPHADQLVFNVLQPFGRGLSHLDRLMMPYRELATVLGTFLAAAEVRNLPIFLVDIPYCTTEGVGIPDRARGFVERYVHYDRGKTTARAAEGGSPLRRELRATEGAVPVQGLVEKHRDDQEASRKVRRPDCDGCAYSRVCDGVWRSYVERFGWEEFVPVP
ncbi:MAG: radical SAM protein [Deltaproteobacteria bacterium]|nr:radical SAM protein [Deltaproteobacteria bacterium]